MWLFIIKTIVTAVMFYLVFCFYGNINDGLFIKGFFCIVFLLFMYWVDIYRLTKIFSSYFLACHNFKQQKYERAFVYFQHLLDYSFAPSLPYLALMRFKGLGCEANPETAKYYSERAMRNGYYDCLYFVAVIDFFGDSLTSYFKHAEAKLKPSVASNALASDATNARVYKSNKVYKNVLEPDYSACVFHLKQYLEEVESGKNTDAQYVAEANALLGYCLGAGLGAPSNSMIADKLFAKASALKSANVTRLKNCLHTKSAVTEFII